jgi:serine/threonine protein kinase
MTPNLLQEIFCHKLTTDDFGKHVIRCYGISQDPKTKNYIIVMCYARDGDLRKYLRNNYNDKKLDFKDKFIQLFFITEGLNSIHDEGLIHQDFHPGNILIDYTYCLECYVTDFGLSKPINYQSKKGGIYGVLTYVAPEVLLGKPYTQASDIYSFGIVAYEVLTGFSPYTIYVKEEKHYKELPHDINLALSIINGLRPN